METAQERELQERQAWWSLNTMACSLDISNSCFLFEWDPQLRYFGLGVVGVGAAGDPDDHTHEHELELFFPKCMESPASEASAAVTGLPTAEDDATVVMPEDQLDALLQNFWDLDKEQLVGFNSSCILNEKSTAASFLGDDLLALSSVSPTGPTLPEKTVAQPQAEQPPSSSSSHCNVDPQASDTGGAQRQTARINCSSKLWTTPEERETWSSQISSKRSRTASSTADTERETWSSQISSKRSRTASSTAGSSVVYPFTVVKPSGVDGGATLDDINERILTRPARPVRHPVGEFACAPRVSDGSRPSPSGKTVAGFTRLHTAGRGTITIIRTTG